MYLIQRLFVGFFFTFFNLAFIAAQKVVPANHKADKMTHYKGKIDDISDVSVSLNCQGKNCKGELTYVRSRDQFRLEGTLEGNQLQLREFNEANKCTGYLNGQIEGEDIQLAWKNKEGTIGNTIKLKEVGRKPNFPSFCGDNKWINAYSGKIDGAEVDMILQRVDNNRILGAAYYLNQNKKVLLSGKLSDNNNLHLNFIDEKTSAQIATLRGVFQQNRGISASFYDKQQAQKFVFFQLKKTLAVSCLEYADYYTNYDFLFPKSSNAIFNEIMILLTTNWINDCRDNAQKIRKRETDDTTRASQRAYSWADIALLTDNFISGMLTYQATWTNGEATKTFNFDLKTGEAIELATLFKKGFDYSLFIKKYAAKEIIKNPIYKHNKDFRNWIKNQEFSFFTIGKKGISFYTDYHIIYDRQRIMIPYKKLNRNIRKNAPVRELF